MSDRGRTPQAMTLEAGIAALVEEEMVRYGDGISYAKASDAKRSLEDFAEAVRELVVARDEASDDLTTAYLVGYDKGRHAARAEASELRAAIREWFSANDAWDALMETGAASYDYPTEKAASERINRAEDNLRRLAGKDEQ